MSERSRSSRQQSEPGRTTATAECPPATRRRTTALPRNPPAPLTTTLIEALALSALGGVVGILVGVLATLVVSNTAGWQTILEPVQSLVAFLIAMGVGVFFGYYPARKAARLDPIRALRYE